jgi:hypothetical protein
MPKDIDKQFCYLRKYCVLVCREHATGVLNLYAQHFCGRPIKPAQDVALPAALSPPIEELRQPLDGLACEQDGCSFITISVDLITHQSDKSDWIDPSD